MHHLILVLEDVRSTHNVGSILRIADCLGVSKVYFCGITPYPRLKQDERLPHLSEKIDKQIRKTALGAENFVRWEYCSDIKSLLSRLKSQNYTIIGLEQTENSVPIDSVSLQSKTALIVGNEVAGLSLATREQCDLCTEIKMHGKKESLNVSNATAIAVFALMLQ